MKQGKNKGKEVGSMISLLFVALGIADAVYLTIEHYSGKIPPCTLGGFADCGQVLRSQYALIMGFPLSLLGVAHYTLLFVLLFMAFYTQRTLFKRLIFLITAVGIVFSLYLVFVQLIIIKAICFYCMGSAGISLILYLLVRYVFSDEYREIIPMKFRVIYQLTGKPAFFLLDPEFVHDNAMRFGEFFGKIPLVRGITRFLFRYDHPFLKQKVAGIVFENPIGLAAGYDYRASFPQILPSIGYGFQTIGTITKEPSEGNDKPRLGRLIKSRSFMVNKGFRNIGADAVITKWKNKKFEFPVGISIGVTNCEDIQKEDEGIADIISTFRTFEKASLKHAFYELNISCPNLKTSISFYEPKALTNLLSAVEKCKIKHPIFIKMPIDKTDEEVKKMLDVIMKYKITGVIFGNLQKNRKDKTFVKEEVAQWKKGNFSGKPTFKRSNELIQLAYLQVGKKLVIIGCGGVFSGEDAYIKIKKGATLVQMITGMIFEGPQVIGQINRDLVKLLEKDGYKNILDAVGVNAH
jgi:dihydroorotate dehydrogenase subfamily 2